MITRISGGASSRKRNAQGKGDTRELKHFSLHVQSMQDARERKWIEEESERGRNTTWMRLGKTTRHLQMQEHKLKTKQVKEYSCTRREKINKPSSLKLPRWQVHPWKYRFRL